MKGKWVVTLCAISIVVSILGILILTESAWAQPAKKGVLKIGMTGPLSGAGIIYGYASLAALQLTMDEINQAGGLKVGDTVYTLEAIPYDTKYISEPAVTAAKRLVFEDKVKIIFGEIGSAAGLAMQAITEPNKVIFLPDTYTERMLSPDKPYTFRMGITPVEFAPSMLAYYRQRFLQAKRIGYLFREDETGRSMLRLQQKHAPETRFEIVPFPVEPGTMDLTPLVTKLLAGNVDILDANGNPPGEVAQIVNIAKGMGWTKPIVRTGGPIVDELIRLCGKNANGFIYREDSDLSQPKLVALVNRFKAKGYPATPCTNMPPFYDAAHILFQAIQKAGTIEDTTKIKEALESIQSYDGIQGKVRWGGKDTYGINHQLLNPSFIGEIIDGKPTILQRVDIK